MDATEPTGVLVIRAWLEDVSEQPSLRARITQTVDVSAAEPTEQVAASEEEVVLVVEAWLRLFTSGS